MSDKDVFMKQNNTYKGLLPAQSRFDHKYACWANNHRGWAKMKKFNKKLAKKRLRHEQARQLKED